ncbi:MAG: helix-turn-helix domain-containing protein [Prevotella sp.]|nr:helix-turn-helix domain-containing protein [Prevotella sp.]
MYYQIREDTFYIMLYAMVTAMAMMASCYLLFRQGNAFARDVTPPLRLRRWAAAFFAFLALNHVWYMPIVFLTSNEDIKVIDLVGGLLDSMTFMPLAIIVLLTMLQDRRRPLWPVALMFAPLVVFGVFSVATHSYAFQLIAYIYFLLMCMGLFIYMVRALRQYGRWLRDNYADLEHKEVWQSFVVLAIILLVFVIYMFVYEGSAYLYAMQVIIILLIYYLLWRVETLSDLSMPTNDEEEKTVTTENVENDELPLSLHNSIGLMLQQHCIEKQLYLQHDLTLQQLATAVGTNRFYLSQYFSSQDMTYNAYINNLRINHFVSLYQEAIATHRHFSVQQLASESGYRSYSTFSRAFNLRMGQNVREWMCDTTQNCSNQQK